MPEMHGQLSVKENLITAIASGKEADERELSVIHRRTTRVRRSAGTRNPDMIKISFAGPFGHVRRTLALTALVTQQHSFPRQPQSEDMIEQRHEMALLKIEPMHPKSPMMAPLLCSGNLLLMRTLTSVSVR